MEPKHPAPATEDQAALRGLWVAIFVPWVVIVALVGVVVAQNLPDYPHRAIGVGVGLIAGAPLAGIAVLRRVLKWVKSRS
jgi:hypothetical protein